MELLSYVILYLSIEYLYEGPTGNQLYWVGTMNKYIRVLLLLGFKVHTHGTRAGIISNGLRVAAARR